MKKHIAIFIALVVMITATVPALTSCNNKSINAIEVINPVTEYLVGDTIDYDNLKIKVMYSDNSDEEKTVKELKADVQPADLSKLGDTSYTITYKGKSVKVNIKVVEKITPSTKEIKTLEVVNPKKLYSLNSDIDYNNLQLKVTYVDDTTVTDTVRRLGATVTTYADVSHIGKTYYEITLNNKTVKVEITLVEGAAESNAIMAIEWPQFFENYLNASERGENETEGENDFRLTGQAYEVGNANKFIYRPQGTVLSDSGRVQKELQTYAEVSVWDETDKKYKALSDEELSEYVAIDHNTYKFTESAAGKSVQLKIMIDENANDLSALDDPTDKYRIVKFNVIDKGYNVYNQLGLTVMADLEKIAYSEIWKCDVYTPGQTYNDGEKDVTVGQDEVKLVPKTDSLKLEADDKYLCEYVDNISTVILHESFMLNADLMPSMFFWTTLDTNNWSLTGDRYQEAYQSLSSFPEAQKQLVGSLRDGYNSVGDNDGADSARSYMRTIDTTYIEVEGHSVPSGHAIELNIPLNMQKGIFSTKKVDVSGNYNSITSPARGQRSTEKNRVLESYADYETSTKPEDPVSHWSVFQMLQSRIEGSEMQKFELKNIAIKGNNSYFNDTSANYFHQAGLMLCNNYAREVSLNNVNANSFYTNITGDNYGDYTYKTEGNIDKFHSGDDAQSVNAKLTLENTKIYDAYSNMIFLWRSNAIIKNSELKRSGGPLFIMSDADHVISANTSDDGGPSIETDNKSKLEAFATGQESWYAIWGAQAIFTALGNIMTPPLESVDKTFYKSNDQGKQAINVIAVMICAPDLILTGGDHQGKDRMLDVRGRFTQYGEDGTTPLNNFKMHNDSLIQFRTLSLMFGQNAKSFAPIIQSGNQFAYVTPPNVTDGATGSNFVLSEFLGASGLGTGKFFKQFEEDKLNAWKQGATDKLCIYLSAGAVSQESESWAPYIGLVTDLYDITK